MSVLTELGSIWIKQTLSDLQKRRNAAFDMAQRCKPDGEYRKQVEMVVALYDQMLAAPDLLKACQRLLIEVQWEASRADVVTDEARADIAMAKAAIAKATGAKP